MLSDDCEQVCSAAVQLIWAISQLYPESTVPIPSSNEEIRLVDDAFGAICPMVSDGSWVVRVQAAKLLGSMEQVSFHILEQTLNKKPMSGSAGSKNGWVLRSSGTKGSTRVGCRLPRNFKHFHIESLSVGDLVKFFSSSTSAR